jgi:pimeloyl-ACP methyl ester carboxylesterase
MNAGLLRLATLAACAATGSATAGEPGPRKPPAASRLLEPCEVSGVQGKARCGTYEVYENRDTRTGRKISLKIVVVPATGSERLSDPYVFLNGGPGESSTEAAASLAREFAKLRERRDILLVDQRGTGGSHPLN